jgi:DNA-binding transcriptional MerR regulator
MSYTIQKLATLAGVSVRTLHHYDAIGLLTPTRDEENGYRVYEEAELLTLQQILFYRELEVPLEEIKTMLHRSDFTLVSALQKHREALQHKQKRLEKLLKTIDTTLLKLQTHHDMPDEELYDAFKDEDVKPYQDEAHVRWGNTDAYQQSMARVSKLTKAQMNDLKAKGAALTERLAAVMKKNPAGPEAQALIEEHYHGIQFFYDCPLSMYENLGEMYVNDPRFTAYYDKFRPGLAVFLRDAIKIYCATKQTSS